MSRANAANSVGAEDRAILYEGANKSQLAVLFKCDDDTLTRKMHGIKPVGKRNNAMVYDVAEVAGRMGKLTEEQVELHIRRMNHADLPKALTKEFWAGLRSKQEYELKAGDLWPTVKVVEVISEMVKTLKMELDLLTDAIERQTEMSSKQRELAIMLVDGAKTNMLQRLRDQAVKAAHTRPAVEDDDEL